METKTALNPPSSLLHAYGRILVLLLVGAAAGYLFSTVGSSYAYSRIDSTARVDLHRPITPDQTELVPASSICIIQANTNPFKPLQDDEDLFADRNDFLRHTTYYLALYSYKHNYSFRRLHVPTIPGRHGGWPKLLGINDTLSDPRCSLVVYFDGDAYIKRHDLRIEQLMERWGWGEKTILSLALDPDEPVNYFNGTLSINTGFWIIRKHPKSFQIIKDMLDCPKEREDCARWATAWAHDQTVFTTYIMPNLDTGIHKEFIQVPCTEANGWSEWGGCCKGQFITHRWSTKTQVGGDLEKLIKNDAVMSELYQKRNTTDLFERL